MKRRISIYYLSLIFLSIIACSKKDYPVEEQIDKFSYEVECTSCEISFTDELNNLKSIRHTTGKWEYRFNRKVNFQLSLSIKTTLNSQQSIQAYILKNGDVVYGGMGFNHAVINYDIFKDHGTSSYGSYQNHNSGNTGGTSQPQSSVCGAKNKTGGYCKRVVSGGGRCWQHR